MALDARGSQERGANLSERSTVPEDFRIYVGWSTSPKRWRMYDAFGPDAVIAITDLWEWVTMNRPDGDLRGLTARDIARAARLTAAVDPEAWVALLARTFDDGGCELLDGEPPYLKVHNWKKRQPFVFTAEDRSERARDAATKRWDRQREVDARDASGMRRAQRSHADGNAPTDPTSPTDPSDPDRAHRDMKPEKRRTKTEPKPVMSTENQADLGRLIQDLSRKKAVRK